MAEQALAYYGYGDDENDDKQGSQPPRTLLNEILEGMALSMLIYLLADIRFLSATGRVGTRYETLALDDAFLLINTAERMAGLVDEEEDLPPHLSPYDGLSPAQLMAIAMTELKRIADKRRKQRERERQEQRRRRSTAQGSNINKRATDSLRISLAADPKEKRKLRLEDDIHGLFRASASMIGRDLIDKVPYIEARRSALHLSTEMVEEHPSHDFVARTIHLVGRSKARKSLLVQEDGEPSEEGPFAAFGRISKHEMEKLQMDQVADTVFNMGRNNQMFRQSITAYASSGVDRSMPSSCQSLAEDELLTIMERAVASRDHDRLDFMPNFFRPNTISHIMAKSDARVVWMNDWFSTQEMTYAIAVDKAKKRVLVVFRGCKTRHDWSKALDFGLIELENPVLEDFEDRPETIGVHRGFWDYLFRRRMDTMTTKYDEISGLAHKYGRERIGDDYKLVVNGHSLGGALSTLFSFYASLDDRFTRNGAVLVLTFANPMLANHQFADCFRFQEECGLLQHIRVYNSNDFISRIPANVAYDPRGSRYRHVGIGVQLPRVPRNYFRKWEPKVSYVGRERFWNSYQRAVRKNCFLHLPSPWRTVRVHVLSEFQKRMLDGQLRNTGWGHLRLDKSIDDLYEELAHMPCRDRSTGMLAI